MNTNTTDSEPHPIVPPRRWGVSMHHGLLIDGHVYSWKKVLLFVLVLLVLVAILNHAMGWNLPVVTSVTNYFAPPPAYSTFASPALGTVPQRLAGGAMGSDSLLRNYLGI